LPDTPAGQSGRLFIVFSPAIISMAFRHYFRCRFSAAARQAFFMLAFSPRLIFFFEIFSPPFRLFSASPLAADY